MKKRYSILFICLGNICRSPAAEAIMKKYISDRMLDDKIFVDSAGIIAYHEGENADSRMIAHASRRGYNLTHISRPVQLKDFEEFDLIIGMDNNNIKELKKLSPKEHAGKIDIMTNYLVNKTAVTVPDPYYGGASGFENVLDILEDACMGLLNKIEASED